MNRLAGILLLFCCIAGAFAADCSVRATIQRRAGSWVQSDGVYQIFDMSITNTGRCNFAKVLVNLSISDNSTIVNSWNYNPLTAEVFNFGYLASGQSFSSAGIIVRNTARLPATPVIAAATAICDIICIGTPPPTVPPTTPPTSTPTPNPNSTAAPTGTPTGTPTPTPTGTPTGTPTTPPDSQCQLSVVQSRRIINGGSWVADGFAFQIYDLLFTNTGSKPVKSAVFSEGLSVGYPVSWWGLEKSCCDQVRSSISYNVSLFQPFYVGATFSAGYILRYNASATLVDPTFTSPIVQTPFFKWVTC